MELIKSIIILFTINFKIIITTLILGKYSKIELEKSYSSFNFDSSEFFLLDTMIFEFKTKGTCEPNISYQYYDDTDSSFKKYETSFQLFPYEEKNENGFEIKCYSLVKKSEDLNGLDGNFVFFKIKCSDSIEIRNINPNLDTGYIILIILAALIIIGGIVGFIIYKFCYSKKSEKSENKQKKDNETEDNKKNNEDVIQGQKINRSYNNNNNTNNTINNTNKKEVNKVNTYSYKKNSFEIINTKSMINNNP